MDAQSSSLITQNAYCTRSSSRTRNATSHNQASTIQRSATVARQQRPPSLKQASKQAPKKPSSKLLQGAFVMLPYQSRNPAHSHRKQPFSIPEHPSSLTYDATPRYCILTHSSRMLRPRLRARLPPASTPRLSDRHPPRISERW
jgi:hypothetical protein